MEIYTVTVVHIYYIYWMFFLNLVKKQYIFMEILLFSLGDCFRQKITIDNLLPSSFAEALEKYVCEHIIQKSCLSIKVSLFDYSCSVCFGLRYSCPVGITLYYKLVFHLLVYVFSVNVTFYFIADTECEIWPVTLINTVTLNTSVIEQMAIFDIKARIITGCSCFVMSCHPSWNWRVRGGATGGLSFRQFERFHLKRTALPPHSNKFLFS